MRLCLPKKHLFLHNLSINFYHSVSQNRTQVSSISSSGSDARFLIGLSQANRKSVLCHRFNRRLTSNLNSPVQMHPALRRLHLQIVWNVPIDCNDSCRIVDFTMYSVWSIIDRKVFAFSENFGLWFVSLTALNGRYNLVVLINTTKFASFKTNNCFFKVFLKINKDNFSKQTLKRWG